MHNTLSYNKTFVFCFISFKRKFITCLKSFPWWWIFIHLTHNLIAIAYIFTTHSIIVICFRECPSQHFFLVLWISKRIIPVLIVTINLPMCLQRNVFTVVVMLTNCLLQNVFNISSYSRRSRTNLLIVFCLQIIFIYQKFERWYCIIWINLP